MNNQGVISFLLLYFLLLVSAQDNATSTDDVVSSSNSTADAANATSADSDDSEAVVATESTSTTTIAPLDVKCQCLGDSELLAKKENTRKVLEICRNNAKARITVDGLGYVAERYRCGSRTPSNPSWTWDSLCNCTQKNGKEGLASKGFWMEIQIKDQDRSNRWETYNPIEEKSPHALEDPNSNSFMKLKKYFEKALDGLMLESDEAIGKGFVKNVVMKFTRGDGTNLTTTTTTTTTTAKPTTASAGDDNADSADIGSSDAASTNTTDTDSVNATVDASDETERRKREAETTTSTTTTVIVYNSYYVKIHVETQFMDENITKAEFKSIYEEDVKKGNSSEFVTAETSFPPLPTCSNADLTFIMPDVMESMEHDKPIILKNLTKKCLDQDILNMVRISMNCTEDGTDKILTKTTCENSTSETLTELETTCSGTNGTAKKDAAIISEPLLQYSGGNTILYDSLELTTGEQIEIICKDPLTRPSQDWYDHDPWDGKITAVCQSDGAYNVRATQLAVCVTVCDQHMIPEPDMTAGLQFTGVKRKLNGKVQSKEKMESSEYIWDGDALVYSCKEPKYGVMGGVDKVLDMYTCQGSSGKYNVPNGLNMENEDERQPWPVCQPQRYMVIEAVEMMLAKYDFRISNRYKLIRYEADDAKANLRPGADHFIEVTIPAVVCMLVLIIVVLLCSKNDSPVCKICASKDA